MLKRTMLERSMIEMKLIVLGATGGTGLEIVRRATAKGHSVTALVRSPDRLKQFSDRITVKQGDLCEKANYRFWGFKISRADVAENPGALPTLT